MSQPRSYVLYVQYSEISIDYVDSAAFPRNAKRAKWPFLYRIARASSTSANPNSNWAVHSFWLPNLTKVTTSRVRPLPGLDLHDNFHIIWWQIRNLVGLSFPTPEKEVKLLIPMNVRPAEAFEKTSMASVWITAYLPSFQVAFPPTSSLTELGGG